MDAALRRRRKARASRGTLRLLAGNGQAPHRRCPCTDSGGTRSMDKLMHELEQARDDLAPRWDEARSARLFAGTLQRKRRRAVQRGAAASIGALCAVSALAVVIDPRHEHASRGRRSRGSRPAARSGHTLRMADGSSAQLVGDQQRARGHAQHGAARRAQAALGPRALRCHPERAAQLRGRGRPVPRGSDRHDLRCRAHGQAGERAGDPRQGPRVRTERCARRARRADRSASRSGSAALRARPPARPRSRRAKRLRSSRRRG